jgi:hypothetical protein
MVETCTHYENGKMRPVETVLRMGEENDINDIKENDKGGEFN